MDSVAEALWKIRTHEVPDLAWGHGLHDEIVGELVDLADAANDLALLAMEANHIAERLGAQRAEHARHHPIAQQLHRDDARHRSILLAIQYLDQTLRLYLASAYRQAFASITVLSQLSRGAEPNMPDARAISVITLLTRPETIAPPTPHLSPDDVTILRQTYETLLRWAKRVEATAAETGGLRYFDPDVPLPNSSRPDWPPNVDLVQHGLADLAYSAHEYAARCLQHLAHTTLSRV